MWRRQWWWTGREGTILPAILGGRARLAQLRRAVPPYHRRRFDYRRGQFYGEAKMSSTSAESSPYARGASPDLDRP
jgi:hypothetical protein